MQREVERWVYRQWLFSDAPTKVNQWPRLALRRTSGSEDCDAGEDEIDEPEPHRAEAAAEPRHHQGAQHQPEPDHRGLRADQPQRGPASLEAQRHRPGT